MNVMRKIVATNLRRWMANDSELNSQPKLSLKSKVSQSHIGRILREESSATVDMLEDIAKAFKRHPADLLQAGDYADGATVKSLALNEPEQSHTIGLPAQLSQLLDVAHRLSRDGQHVLLGQANELVKQYPLKTKAAS
jgi:transcriptional regulator with XRE-family HTH domain